MTVQPRRAPDAGPPDAASAISMLATVCMLAHHYDIPCDLPTLAHRLALADGEPWTAQDAVRAARHLGLKAKCIRTRAERLSKVPLPALAILRDAQGVRRMAIVMGCDASTVSYMEPHFEDEPMDPRTVTAGEFALQWTGELVLVASQASLVAELARFDFSWFIPSLVKYRRLLGEVLLVSLVLQVFALVSPLFFQVVMDKVLVHRGMTTLDVLVVGLIIVVLFESALSGLRSYVFGHTTNRIDVELGSRLFRHLAQLPLPYFQARRVGDSVARVRELENIRSFLTGNALTVVMDVVFSVLFIGVMLLYSVPLTLIVLASLPLYFCLSLVVVPILRERLDRKFARGAENQAMLVETITAIQTVKASALEPALAKRWDNQLAAYVAASFKTQNLASWAHEGINLIGKLASAGMLWFGAQLVMKGDLTVGQFVAFTMFAQRVAQPIIRMAQLWTDFQQTGISMARLADILDSRPELPPSTVAQLPPMAGRITLEKVGFRYRPDTAAVLDDISLDIQPGEVIGLVGRSGSGKSTLTKLVQRLYIPERGQILVDGIDIALVDTAQLRRQVGVVLQESMLFNRSVRENIAIARPSAPIEAVMQVARLAGAHEFVSALPEGYDTVVGEQGALLSGGQRQRIAIARALFTDPRILIFDEATSALDYESEAIIQRNMAKICVGRTVLIIAHRLSAVRHADRIIVLEKGRIVEAGPHRDLVRKHRGLYAHLWRLQDGVQEATEETLL